jgi:hypothetical protein
MEDNRRHTQYPGQDNTFKKQGTHRQGRYNTIQESGVGRAGFVEDPVTLWKEVSEEIR